MRNNNVKTAIIVIVGIFGGFLLGCTLTYIFTFKDSNDYYEYYTKLAQEQNSQIKSSIYKINYFKEGGNYSISPVGKGGEMYVGNSSVPLEQFLGKKVKIAGNWVLTTKTLKHSGYPQDEWQSPVGAVNISNIHLTQ